jgi:flagellar basal body rod protein FlgG
MDIGMYQGAAALNTYEEWQNNVAHNLANVSTVGFKGKRISIEKDPLGKIQANTHDTFQRLLIGSSPEAHDKLNLAQSELIQSNNPTDMAIDGDGFFQVQKTNGEKILTRNGEFRLNQDNILVNSRGEKVLTQDGAGIEIDPDLEHFIVNRGGEVFQGDTQVGILGVSVVDKPEKLQQVDGGFRLGDATIKPAIEGDYSVYQGFKESSNSKALNEMVQMINLSRSYEANAKVIQAYDSRFGQSISQLAT